jgi:ribosome assembly protein YihI (activator of Der GTPase)
VTVLAEAKKEKKTKKRRGVNPGRMERRTNAHGKKGLRG